MKITQISFKRTGDFHPAVGNTYLVSSNEAILETDDDAIYGSGYQTWEHIPKDCNVEVSEHFIIKFDKN